MFSVIAFLAGYLLGSIPTGFLAVKVAAGKDIRSEGSGKTGGFNTYTVTRSRWVAIGVGIFDGLKGLAASLGGMIAAPNDPTIQGIAIIGALLGHNYPVWLRFKGGRGLATVAGALFVVSEFLVLFWCTMWFLMYVRRKDILESNMFSSVVSIPAVWLLPDEVSQMLMARDVSPTYHAWLITVVCLLLLVGHHDAIRALLTGRGLRDVRQE
jgi:glycerol-3-phosphate acyltransferase PlsY